MVALDVWPAFLEPWVTINWASALNKAVSELLLGSNERLKQKEAYTVQRLISQSSKGSLEASILSMDLLQLITSLNDYWHPNKYSHSWKIQPRLVWAGI